MFLKTTLIILFLVLSTPAWALDNDREQPIKLRSNSLQHDEQTGRSIYQGDVEIKQGSMIIRGDRVEVISNKGVFIKATVTGQPAFMQQTQNNGELAQATASLMIYHKQKQEIFMQGNAEAKQGANEFRAAEMFYDLERELINAKADENNGSEGRVEIIFQPEKKEAQP